MLRGTIIVAIVLLAIVGSLAFVRMLKVRHARATYVELPSEDEIDEIQAEVSLEGFEFVLGMKDTTGDEFHKFAIPRSHWKSVLDSLRPYDRPNATFIPSRPTPKGLVVGELHFRLKDGSKWHTRLLIFGEYDHINFRIGPNSVGHQGGDKRRLYESLKAAYAASENVN